MHGPCGRNAARRSPCDCPAPAGHHPPTWPGDPALPWVVAVGFRRDDALQMQGDGRAADSESRRSRHRRTGSTRLRSLALPARFVRSGQWPRNGSYRPRGPSRGPTAGTRSPKAVLRPPGQLWGALSVPPTPDPFCKLIGPFHPHRRQAWARWCCSPIHQPLSCLCCGRSDPFKDFGVRRDFGNAYPQARGLERL